MPHPITIRFFAHLKDLAGVPSVSLPVEQDCSLKQLIAQLEETMPSLKSFATDETIRIALNYAVVNREVIIHPGDEVAFLPPFSGG